MVFRKFLSALAFTALGALGMSGAASGESVLRVAMTAGDLPDWTGQPSQGFEGYRFVGWNLYDALVGWDLSNPDKAAPIKPGLALSWAMDPQDKKKWILKLRQDVKFHDGCDWNANVAKWNIVRVTDEKSPQFNAAQYARVRSRTNNIDRAEVVDPYTLAIYTKQVDPVFYYNLAYVFMISECQLEKDGNNYDEFAKHPSGTGPYMFSTAVPRQRLELVKNPNYWDKARVPKHDRLVLYPMPESTSRVAALMSGEVNFIENPPPDSLARLKSAGMNVILRPYPHNWDYLLNFKKKPFTDLRVRQAANYAIDRDEIVAMLGGTAMAGYATLTPSQPNYGNPVLYKHDVEKAKALLKDAGCLPCSITIGVSTSGSGQMQPIPMNELIKSHLEAAGFKVTLKTMDWNSLLSIFFKGTDGDPTLDAINVSLPTQDPVTGLVYAYTDSGRAPAGYNWGWYHNDKIEAAYAEIRESSDPQKIDALFTKIHEISTEDAARVFIAHDMNPRALSPKLSGFVQAQSWFQDLTPIVVNP